MNPRIYVYRITFVDQPHWYWGWHKEKKYDEYYMGSPKAHSDFWEKYEPRKEILRVFDFTEEGAILAQTYESWLIEPDLENPLCLNESLGGIISPRHLSECAKERWKSPGFRERVSAAVKRNWEDPSYREKMSKVMKQRWENPSYREKMYEIIRKNLKLGRVCDAQCRERLSRNLKEKWRDEDYRNMVCESLRKKWEDEDYKEKMSKIAKERWVDEDFYLTGVAQLREVQMKGVIAAKSEEAKRKRKETFKAIQHQKGERNSQFGKQWITDGTKEGNRVISKGDPIPEGFYPEGIH